MRFTFEDIDKSGDVTDVTYPFVFSDGGSPPGEAAQSKAGPLKASEEAVRSRARASRSSDSIARPRTSPQQFIEPARYNVTLNGAASSAASLQKWWNRDFAAPARLTAKYPKPNENPDAGISKNSVAKHTDYLKKMTGKTADDYRIYLETRNDYSNSPIFYFDMANWFYSLDDKETALRVLTSIADLELENASLYRLLGYRFKEYGEYSLAKFVSKKVADWRPMDPQSYRDYALALADNGEAQAALDSLHALLKRPYPRYILNRTRGIEEVIVTDINHLIAKNPHLDTSGIDKRLMINIPVDIRVVINWNMDNTDLDLHVKDPNNEVAYFGNRSTGIGGRMSAGIASGYGPEQFLLKKAVPGKYQASVCYYGAREFADAGPSTVMAEIYTNYGGKTEQRQVVCLQLSNVKKTKDNMVLVWEFVL
jgi:tetratricopeptide (TPR) repeat protein